MKLVLLFTLLIYSAQGISRPFMPKSFKATFIQKQKSKISKKVKESRGEISYLYPGHLKLLVTHPEKETLVSTPATTWIYTPPYMEGEKGQVIIKKTGVLAPVKFFDYMKSGLSKNDNYKVSVVSRSVIDVIFNKSIAKKSGLKKARLFFKIKRKFEEFKKIRFFMTNGKEREIELSSIKVTAPLTKSDFTFTIPPGTTIQK